MLVLSRKETETIHVGEEVTIVIVRTGTGRVKVGIVAPEGVPVERGEVRDRRLAFGEPSESSEEGNLFLFSNDWTDESVLDGSD
ncbi:carbon storage regulator [Rubinisphaera brasiliensis]|uniref:Translational regulator CsrA n=1 Tax=Rubinisphaera brasiliensis (strain ATCC 49424 / DSM 5305 / JCM 21570 / IAM 15109 / NBRC 103401 / IFAM 1448) TaxID=756272 RepID=F0SJ22_RUBBR|nr:carbon storage regulator [Rubinisphaera brasiliensis]ADY58564.1 carbon storage regulator [Rubinisphaera brasiliensis DSM 5305]